MLDDTDAGFSSLGAWVSVDNGYQDTSLQSLGNSSSDFAQWSFRDLASGLYQPAAHWNEHVSQSSNALFDIFESGERVSRTTVNQQFTPNDDDGSFQFLGAPIYVETGDISVRLLGAEQSSVNADAIKLIPLDDPSSSININELPKARLTLSSAGETATISAPIAMSGNFLLRRALANPAFSELIQDGTVIATLPVSTSSSATVNVSIDRFDPGTDTAGIPDDSLNFSAKANDTTVFGFNTGDHSDLAVRAAQDDIDELLRNHAAADVADHLEIERQVSTQVLHLSVTEYFHRLNLAADLWLGSANGLAGMMAVATSSGDWISHIGGEFGFIPTTPRLIVPTPSVRATDFTKMTDKTLHEFALEDANIRRQILESLTNTESRSFGRLVVNASDTSINLRRIVADSQVNYLDLNSGESASSVNALLSLHSGQENYVGDLVDNGYMVSVVPKGVAMAGLVQGGYSKSIISPNGFATWDNAYFYGSGATTNKETYVHSVTTKTLAPLDNANLRRTDIDVSLPSIGIPVNINRHYDSGIMTNQGFGSGWSFTYGSYLETTTNQDQFTWHGPDGNTVVLANPITENGVTTYSYSSRFDGTTATKTTLDPNNQPRDQYIVTTKHGDTYIFEEVSSKKSHLVEMSDRNGNRHIVTYNANGLHQVIDATVANDPRTRLTFVVADGVIESVTDDIGRMWTYDYLVDTNVDTDGDGDVDLDDETVFRLEHVVHPHETVTPPVYPTYVYGTELGETGRLISASVSGQPATTFKYTPTGRLRSRTDASNRTQYYRYDDFANGTGFTSPSGRLSERFFNTSGRLVKSVSTDGSTVTNTYDATTTHLTGTTNAIGVKTSYEYDKFGNLVRQSDGQVESIVRYDGQYHQPLFSLTRSLSSKNSISSQQTNILDEFGNVIEVVDAFGNVTRRTYTSRGLLETETLPSGNQSDAVGDYLTYYRYDDNGLLVERTSLSEFPHSDSVSLALSGSYSSDADITWISDVATSYIEQTNASTTTLHTLSVGQPQDVQTQARIHDGEIQPTISLVNSSPFDNEALTYHPDRIGSATGYQQPFRNVRNVAVGASVTATNAHSTSIYFPSNVTDGHYGNGSSYIALNHDASLTIELDQIERIRRLTYGQDRAYGYNNRQIQSFSIEVSLDGVNYSTVFDSETLSDSVVNLSSISSSHTVAADFAPVEAKFVRFNGHRASSDRFQVDEIEVFAADDVSPSTASISILNESLNGEASLQIVSASPFDPTLRYNAPDYSNAYGYRQPYNNPNNIALSTLGAKVTGTSRYSNREFYDANNLIDGHYGYGSSFITGTSNGSFTVELPQVENIDRVRFGQDRIAGYNNRQATDFTIEVSIDGANFLKAFDSSSLKTNQPPGTLPAKHTIEATFQDVNAKFIRFFSPKNGYQIDEFEIFRSETPPNSSLLSLVTSSSFDPSLLTHEPGYSSAAYQRQPYQNSNNVALNATVSVTGQSNSGVLYKPVNLTDGHYGRGSSYRASNAGSEQIILDWGELELIDQVTFGGDRSYGYNTYQIQDFLIETTVDGINWTTVFDSEQNINGSVDQGGLTKRHTVSASFEPISASSLRFTGKRNGGLFIIDELEVHRSTLSSDWVDQNTTSITSVSSSSVDLRAATYAEGYARTDDYLQLPYRNPSNVALGAIVTATNIDTGSQYSFENLVDGKYGLGSSYLAGEYDSAITIELEQIENIDRITFGEDRAGSQSGKHLQNFWIETSLDGINYSVVFDSTHMVNSEVDLVELESDYTVSAQFSPVDARFVRLHGHRQLKTSVKSGKTTTHYWHKFQLDEIEVFSTDTADIDSPPLLEGPLNRINELNVVTGSPFDPALLTYAPEYSNSNGYRQPFENDANVALGARVSATSQYSDFYGIGNLTDGHYGNGSTFIAGTSNTSVTIEFDQTEHFDTLTYSNERMNASVNGRRATEFTIEVSSDGKNFLEVFDSNDTVNASVDLGYLSPNSTVQASFQPVNAKYLRFFSPTSGYRIDEIEVFDSSKVSNNSPIELVTSSSFDPSLLTHEPGYSSAAYQRQPYQNSNNVALNATVSVTGQSNSGVLYKPVNLTDGHYGRGSSYRASNAGSEQIILDWGELELIDQVTFGGDRSYGYNTYQIQDFLIETTVDGINWTTVFDSEHLTGSLNLGDADARHTIAASFEPVIASQLRFTGKRSGGLFIIDEIEVNRHARFENFLISTSASQSLSVAKETFVYDAQYRLKSIMDASGIETQYTYDDRGNVISVIQPDPDPSSGMGNLTSSATFDAFGNVLTQSDFEGNLIEFTYDELGRLLTQTQTDDSDPADPVVLTTQYFYDADGNPVQSIDPQDRKTTNHYDSAGRVIATTRPDGSFTQVAYNAKGQVESTTDVTGAITSFQYDDFGRLNVATNPSGGQVAYQYDLLGRLTSQIGPMGASISFEYDRLGRITRRQTADQAIETFEYDNNGNLVATSVFDISGLPGYSLPANLTQLPVERRRTTTIVYDASSRPIQWTDPLGNISSVTYDSAGRTLSQTDPLGNVTNFVYDAAGRLYETILPPATPGAERQIIRAGLDANGNTIESEVAVEYDENNDPVFLVVQERVYNSLGAVTELTNALNQTTNFPFDPLASFRTVTDASGRVVTTHTDAVGRPIRTEFQSDDSQIPTVLSETSYDAAGRAVAWKDPLGNQSEAVYDALGNLIEVQSPEVTVGSVSDRLITKTTFDIAGNVLTRTDPEGRMTSFTYDALGRRLTTTLPDPDLTTSGDGPLPAPSISNAYNGFGNLVSQTDHLGRSTHFTYDALGRLKTKSFPTASDETPVTASTYTYDSVGNVTIITDHAGRESTFTYDTAGRLLNTKVPALDESDPSTSSIQASYVYDLSGNLTQSTDILGNVTEIEYDDFGREIRRLFPAASVGGDRPTVQRSYNEEGKLHSTTDITGQTTYFRYKDTGEVDALFEVDFSIVGNENVTPVRSFEYDEAGRVISVEDRRGNVTTYTYDEIGRLVEQSSLDPDGAGPLETFTVSWRYDGVGNVVSQTDSLGRETLYVYDNLNRETTRILPDPDSTVSLDRPHFHKSYDDAGNVASVTDALGNIVTLEYDTLGRLTKETSSPHDGESPITTYRYNDNGQLDRVIDALGHAVSFEYDNWGRQIFQSDPYVAFDPSGAENPVASTGTTLTYDEASRVMSQSDPAGRTTDFEYDLVGNLTKTTYPDLDTTDTDPPVFSTSQYDIAGQLVLSTDTLGRSVRYDYDARGRMIRESLPSLDTNLLNLDPSAFAHSEYEYNDFNDLIAVTDPLGRVTTYEYDNWGRITKETLPDPDGAGPLPAPSTQTTYDASGNVWKTTNHLGHVTETQYDDLDRPVLTLLVDPDGAGPLPRPTFSTEYNLLGAVAAQTDTAGRVTTYQYDPLGRLIQTTLPDPDPTDAVAAPTTSQTYDLLGNILSRTDEDGSTATWTYDHFGRTLTEIYDDPDGPGPDLAPQTTFTYDTAGNLSSKSVLLNTNHWLTTHYAYDQWNRQISVTAPEGDTTQYEYDTQGNLLSTTDDAGNQTSTTYNHLDQPISETNELGKSRTYTYDPIGRLSSRTDRSDRDATYTYDNLDRVIQTHWLDASDTLVGEVLTDYNAAGLIAEIDNQQIVDTYSYNDAGWLTHHARNVATGSTSGLNLPSSSFQYDYLIDGSLDTITQIAGGDTVTTDYGYDAAGRIKTITQSGTGLTEKRVEYTYTDHGQVVALDRFAGTASTTPVITTLVPRDGLGRRTQVSHSAGATTLASYDYTYDALSRVQSIDSLTDGLTTIGLDDNGRLTSAVHTAIPNETFTYDSTGNRIDGNNVIGSNNRLLYDGTFDYEYDDEGNRTSKTNRVTSEKTEYVYDHRDQMIEIRQLDSLGNLTETIKYAYDDSGHRIAKGIDTDADGTIDQSESYVIDGDTMTALLDASGNVQQHFFHGAAVDEVLAQEDAGGEVTWTLADGNKTIRDLAADVAGTVQVVNHRVYDSFGNLESQTDPTVESVFGFTGREYDPDAELHYYRDRWMDPTVGLFTSEDPIGFAGGDINLASYVGGAPYDYTDPTGNSWLSKAWKKITREVKRVVNQISEVVSEAIDDVGDFLEDTWDDVREFAEEHPILTGVAALATGTWFVHAAGGLAAAGAKIGALATKAVGSISTSWAPASSGIGGTFSLNVGSFASLNAGAGISGTSAFASANVSILGLPIAGVGKSVGALGKISDPFASSLVGNFTDAVLQNSTSSAGFGQFSLPNKLFRNEGSTNYSLISGKATGSTSVGSFVSSVAKDTAIGFGKGQFAQTGIPTALVAIEQGFQTYQDVSGAFRDVFAPPQPVPISYSSAKALVEDDPYAAHAELPSQYGNLAIEFDEDAAIASPSDVNAINRPWHSRFNDSSPTLGAYDLYGQYARQNAATVSKVTDNTANWLQRQLTWLGNQSDSEVVKYSLAFADEFLTGGVRAAGAVTASVADAPTTASVVASRSREVYAAGGGGINGIALVVGDFVGTNAIAEAMVGNDLMTGTSIGDGFDRLLHGGQGLSSTMTTIGSLGTIPGASTLLSRGPTVFQATQMVRQGVGTVSTKAVEATRATINAVGRVEVTMYGTSLNPIPKSIRLKPNAPKGKPAHLYRKRLGDAYYDDYQRHVTGRAYEHYFDAGKATGIDGIQGKYLVEAKWAGRNNAAYRNSVYNPANPRYSRLGKEADILDQAERLLQLNQGLGTRGVRYAISNEAAVSHFNSLFRSRFAEQMDAGILKVFHVPGNGM
ncbi:protein containing Coagulation factor 5/8 type [Rhodopirellula sp. SWK7]|nr:protein containing Coagulation factor 5/8 type [Rhodopirellula sp. SWK7]